MLRFQDLVLDVCTCFENSPSKENLYIGDVLKQPVQPTDCRAAETDRLVNDLMNRND